MLTGSTTVLQCIRNIDKKQLVFATNRIAKTLDSKLDQWKHIEGVNNPGDMGTRGISYPENMESNWLQVPFWLKDEDWILDFDQKLTDEHNQPDNQFEMTSESQEQTFFGALASHPIDWDRFAQFNRLRLMTMKILILFPRYK